MIQLMEPPRCAQSGWTRANDDKSKMLHQIRRMKFRVMMVRMILYEKSCLIRQTVG
jgi:hypothetical protein